MAVRRINFLSLAIIALLLSVLAQTNSEENKEPEDKKDTVDKKEAEETKAASPENKEDKNDKDSDEKNDKDKDDENKSDEDKSDEKKNLERKGRKPDSGGSGEDKREGGDDKEERDESAGVMVTAGIQSADDDNDFDTRRKKVSMRNIFHDSGDSLVESGGKNENRYEGHSSWDDYEVNNHILRSGDSEEVTSDKNDRKENMEYMIVERRNNIGDISIDGEVLSVRRELVDESTLGSEIITMKVYKKQLDSSQGEILDDRKHNGDNPGKLQSESSVHDDILADNSEDGENFEFEEVWVNRDVGDSDIDIENILEVRRDLVDESTLGEEKVKIRRRVLKPKLNKSQESKDKRKSSGNIKNMLKSSVETKRRRKRETKNTAKKKYPETRKEDNGDDTDASDKTIEDYEDPKYILNTPHDTFTFPPETLVLKRKSNYNNKKVLNKLKTSKENINQRKHNNRDVNINRDTEDEFRQRNDDDHSLKTRDSNANRHKLESKKRKPKTQIKSVSDSRELESDENNKPKRTPKTNQNQNSDVSYNAKKRAKENAVKYNDYRESEETAEEEARRKYLSALDSDKENNSNPYKATFAERRQAYDELTSGEESHQMRSKHVKKHVSDDESDSKTHAKGRPKKKKPNHKNGQKRKKETVKQQTPTTVIKTTAPFLSSRAEMMRGEATPRTTVTWAAPEPPPVAPPAPVVPEAPPTPVPPITMKAERNRDEEYHESAMNDDYMFQNDDFEDKILIGDKQGDCFAGKDYEVVNLLLDDLRRYDLMCIQQVLWKSLDV